MNKNIIPASVSKGLRSRGVEAEGLEIWTHWAQRELMVVMVVVIVARLTRTGHTHGAMDSLPQIGRME